MTTEAHQTGPVEGALSWALNPNLHGEPAELAAFINALATAQGKMSDPLPKNRTVTVHGKRQDGSPMSYEFAYATLDKILQRALPILAEQGIALIQYPRMARGSLEYVTELRRENAGLTVVVPLVVRGDKPQDLGKAMTYLRRYVITGILAIAADDDTDGPPQEGETGRQMQDRQPRGGAKSAKKGAKQPSEKDRVEAEKKRLRDEWESIVRHLEASAVAEITGEKEKPGTIGELRDWIAAGTAQLALQNGDGDEPPEPGSDG